MCSCPGRTGAYRSATRPCGCRGSAALCDMMALATAADWILVRCPGLAGRESRAAAQGVHGAAERVPARCGAQAPRPHPAQLAEAMDVTPGRVSQTEVRPPPSTPLPANRDTGRTARPGCQLRRPPPHCGHHRSDMMASPPKPQASHSLAGTAGQTLSHGEQLRGEPAMEDRRTPDAATDSTPVK